MSSLYVATDLLVMKFERYVEKVKDSSNLWKQKEWLRDLRHIDNFDFIDLNFPTHIYP